jgi:hypothetical protein
LQYLWLVEELDGIQNYPPATYGCLEELHKRYLFINFNINLWGKDQMGNERKGNYKLLVTIQIYYCYTCNICSMIVPIMNISEKEPGIK